MLNPKMQSVSPCNKRTRRYCAANNPVSFTLNRAERGNLGNFEAVESNGTAFAPQQCLYKKVAVGMENLKKCDRFLGAIKARGVTARQITRFRVPLLGPNTQIWEFSMRSKGMVPHLHQSDVYTKR